MSRVKAKKVAAGRNIIREMEAMRIIVRGQSRRTVTDDGRTGILAEPRAPLPRLGLAKAGAFAYKANKCTEIHATV